MAGPYGDLWDGGNQSGYHTFKTDRLMTELSEYEIVTHVGHADGELISVRRGPAAAPIFSTCLLHRNGRQGPRDLVQDTLVVYIDQLAVLPRALQNRIAASEMLPGGVIGRPTS